MEKVYYLPNGPVAETSLPGAVMPAGYPLPSGGSLGHLPPAPRKPLDLSMGMNPLLKAPPFKDGCGGLHKENRCHDAVKKKLGLHERKTVLLYTRFTECSLKDIVDFVKLFSKRYPEGILLVAGEGYGSAPRGVQGSRERAEVEAEIEKEGLSDFVLFTGWVKREQLKDYLSLGEVAIYPMADTAFNRAKCSAKLIELMVMGKPVIAFPVGEVLTYIKDGESGILAKDAGEMTEKAVELLQDREKAGKIGEGARRFLFDNFNWDKLVSTIDFLKF
jgi:glycosyltransferase involved in cell wall biosynthesis